MHQGQGAGPPAKPVAMHKQSTTEQEDQQTQDQARKYNMNSGKNKSSTTTHSYYALFYQPKHMQTFFLTQIHAQPYPGTKRAS